jgi:hypothetical protein
MLDGPATERRNTDSRHWSQRWMRVSILDSDAVILYDMYQPVHMRGCGRGHCSEVTSGVFEQGKRYRVQRFWEISTCSNCGRFMGYGERDRCLYFGNDADEALAMYHAEEERFLEAA